MEPVPGYSAEVISVGGGPEDGSLAIGKDAGVDAVLDGKKDRLRIAGAWHREQ